MTSLVREAFVRLRDGGADALVDSVRRYASRRRREVPKLLEARRRSLRHRYRYGDAAPDPYRLIHVDPTSVDVLLAPRFQRERSDWGTHVVGGSWDRERASGSLTYATEFEPWSEGRGLVSFEDYTFYRSLRRHFEDGVAWEETELFEWFVESDHGDVRYETRRAALDRFAYLDELYESMRTDGYRTQASLRADETTYTLAPPEQEAVVVNVGRDGTLVFDDGRHRFCIARILGLDSIPVRVLVRHEGWQAHRARIASGDDVEDRSHPDLQDL